MAPTSMIVEFKTAKSKLDTETLLDLVTVQLLSLLTYVVLITENHNFYYIKYQKIFCEHKYLLKFTQIYSLIKLVWQPKLKFEFLIMS